MYKSLTSIQEWFTIKSGVGADVHLSTYLIFMSLEEIRLVVNKVRFVTSNRFIQSCAKKYRKLVCM